MSNFDLTHFLRLGKDKHYIINNYRHGITREGTKYPQNSRHLEKFRISSEVYEAKDVGFSVSEINELVGLGARAVNRRIKLRAEHEPKIVNVLKVIYPDRKEDVPYSFLG